MKKMNKTILMLTIISIILTSSLVSVSADKQSLDRASPIIPCAKIEIHVEESSGIDMGRDGFFGLWASNVHIEGTITRGKDNNYIKPQGISKLFHDSRDFPSGTKVDLHISFILIGMLSDNLDGIWGRAYGITINSVN
jgi:hypothetical protein